jgi:uncharacterized protein (TIGR00369 family)
MSARSNVIFHASTITEASSSSAPVYRQPGKAALHDQKEETMPALREKTFGVVRVEDRNALSGLEFVQGLVSGALPLNTMARTLQYDIVEVSEGKVSVSADPSAEFLNPEGTVHGGFVATLLDTCMGLAIRSMIAKGSGSTTLEFKISMLRPVTADMGSVRAEGSVLTCGRRVGTAEGRLIDGKGKLIAHGTTTCLIFDRQ